MPPMSNLARPQDRGGQDNSTRVPFENHVLLQLAGIQRQILPGFIVTVSTLTEAIPTDMARRQADIFGSNLLVFEGYELN
jgi:hypothetical protein